jgi:hypothetical protein
MPTDLPKEINDAIDLLWEYSDDACLSGCTKAECEDEGYDCRGDSAHFITFVIHKRN